ATFVGGVNDESIPEEDRYWLDCRMRSAIAQLLHRFYDEHGNVIEVDADWIRPGEDYWQETMMVNPPGRSQEISPEGPHYRPEPGPLLNLYGEEVANITTIGDWIKFSRDGSLAIAQTGYRSRGRIGGEMYFCFMYPDGSFKEVAFPEPNILCDITYAVSQDGSISAWNIYNIRNEEESYLLIFNKDGNEIERYDLPHPAIKYITISPDNRYVACSALWGGSRVVDRNTSELLWFDNGSVRKPFFSANSQFCALPEGWVEGFSPVVDLLDNSHQLISNERALLSGTNGGREISINNDGTLLIIGGQVYLNGTNVICNSEFGQNSISPNGYFAYICNDFSLGWEDFVILDLNTLIQEVE
ncbi:MAG: hypothetical protein KAR40_10405, partial [Candidatus Sabulitectum sp.]|nr:hypothetical protein [Candidatus Sabulitectum sp.]